MDYATVELEYLERLIRDSEKLKVLTNYIDKNSYTSKEDLIELFGLNYKEEIKNVK